MSLLLKEEENRCSLAQYYSKKYECNISFSIIYLLVLFAILYILSTGVFYWSPGVSFEELREVLCGLAGCVTDINQDVIVDTDLCYDKNLPQEYKRERVKEGSVEVQKFSYLLL